MDPQFAKQHFGATHYITMKDGVTPQMYYKQVQIPVNNGTVYTGWVYLSFCNIWMGSNIKVGSGEEALLVPIDKP